MRLYFSGHTNTLSWYFFLIIFEFPINVCKTCFFLCCPDVFPTFHCFHLGFPFNSHVCHDWAELSLSKRNVSIKLVSVVGSQWRVCACYPHTPSLAASQGDSSRHLLPPLRLSLLPPWQPLTQEADSTAIGDPTAACFSRHCGNHGSCEWMSVGHHMKDSNAESAKRSLALDPFPCSRCYRCLAVFTADPEGKTQIQGLCHSSLSHPVDWSELSHQLQNIKDAAFIEIKWKSPEFLWCPNNLTLSLSFSFEILQFCARVWLHSAS